MEISPLICSANQWTDFYMTGTSVMKELIIILPHVPKQVMISKLLYSV